LAFVGLIFALEQLWENRRILWNALMRSKKINALQLILINMTLSAVTALQMSGLRFSTLFGPMTTEMAREAYSAGFAIGAFLFLLNATYALTAYKRNQDGRETIRAGRVQRQREDDDMEEIRLRLAHLENGR
jgi:hypothetical protein